MIRRLLSSVLLLAGFGGPGCAQSDEGSLSWKAVGALVEKDFPTVEALSTDSLAAWLDDPARPAPLLLDAREPDEYAVSHLPGAVWVDPDATADTLAARFAAVDPQRPVVVYCSVGYRSARLAAALETAGFSRVQNLDGSIFRWANEGRTVVRTREDGAETSVQQVHPYDATWGRLLDERFHPDGR